MDEKRELWEDCGVVEFSPYGAQAVGTCSWQCSGDADDIVPCSPVEMDRCWLHKHRTPAMAFGATHNRLQPEIFPSFQPPWSCISIPSSL